MPVKNKKQLPKSLKKSFLLNMEEKLTESLAGFPKKINEKKYKKVIHKAARILSKDLSIGQAKAASVKNRPDRTKKSEPADKPEPVSEQII